MLSGMSYIGHKTAAKRSAEQRRCPGCNRGGAISRHTSESKGLIFRACRWEDCKYLDIYVMSNYGDDWTPEDMASIYDAQPVTGRRYVRASKKEVSDGV